MMTLLHSLDILASVSPTPPTEFPSLGKALLYIAGIIFFLLLNAFFVASEFAIVKVRPSQLEAEGKPNSPKIKTALHVVNHLDSYLSANQLGITIASLALGFLGEPFVAALLSPVLLNTGISVWWVKLISFSLAIVSFTFLHVVIGELMPKSIAIRRSVSTTLLLAGPLHAFYRAAHWAIVVLNGTANKLLKVFFNLDPVSESEHCHSAAELAVLVTQSGASKEVTDTEREILINALGLNELWVRDVMTPRNNVIVLDADEPFDKTLEIALRSKHTPVFRSSKAISTTRSA
jgi:CBS domain containing-hemolysin-like protein